MNVPPRPPDKVAGERIRERSPQVRLLTVLTEKQARFLHRIVEVECVYVPVHVGPYLTHKPVYHPLFGRIKRVEAHECQAGKGVVVGVLRQRLGDRARHHALVAQP